MRTSPFNVEQIFRILREAEAGRLTAAEVPRKDAHVGARPARAAALAIGIALVAGACARIVPPAPRPPATLPPPRALLVTATAYNSTTAQTDGKPQEAAWGDRLTPGMRAIAVSRDLEELGLVRGTRVRIEGLPGEYRVLDRTAAGSSHHIDVYMGTDVAAARAFGRKRLRIEWEPATEQTPNGDAR